LSNPLYVSKHILARAHHFNHRTPLSKKSFLIWSKSAVRCLHLHDGNNPAALRWNPYDKIPEPTTYLVRVNDAAIQLLVPADNIAVIRVCCALRRRISHVSTLFPQQYKNTLTPSSAVTISRYWCGQVIGGAMPWPWLPVGGR
jgi:hypothetical protein